MIPEHKFSTIDELLEFISPWGKDPNLTGFVFRGHSKESYELTPTALRLEKNDQLWNMSGLGKPIDRQWDWQSWQIEAEYHLLRSFYRLADQRGLDVPTSFRVRQNLAQEFDTVGLIGHDQQDVWIPTDLHETAALAQHYGVPTRLLDWTYDIYISLYFALRGAVEQEGNLVIWALNKEYLSFLKPTVNRVDLEFITPHYSGNPNLNAQKGLFTLWPVVRHSRAQEIMSLTNGRGALQVDRRPLNELVFSSFTQEENFPIFKKFILPCAQAKRGCQMLDKLGYDSSRVFPGYDGVAAQLQERHKYK
ncbi:FRG domain-containing protein [Pseudomonas salmasensis]|uniref:FRG domain-containing protein n=1 Tax=Pseudomonas salmasensis TaxID=2745514 RepID=A0ABU5FC92_9PSED|nr:FRG domain-containing protein [Pseudomonas salmasensis]MDY4299388.1 FRG domain-containing protein [Pseudomonas salmasensis]